MTARHDERALPLTSNTLQGLRREGQQSFLATMLLILSANQLDFQKKSTRSGALRRAAHCFTRSWGKSLPSFHGSLA
jgi:hypothetical protein